MEGGQYYCGFIQHNPQAHNIITSSSSSSWSPAQPPMSSAEPRCQRHWANTRHEALTAVCVMRHTHTHTHICILAHARVLACVRPRRYVSHARRRVRVFACDRCRSAGMPKILLCAVYVFPNKNIPKNHPYLISCERLLLVALRLFHAQLNVNRVIRKRLGKSEHSR